MINATSTPSTHPHEQTKQDAGEEQNGFNIGHLPSPKNPSWLNVPLLNWLHSLRTWLTWRTRRRLLNKHWSWPIDSNWLRLMQHVMVVQHLFAAQSNHADLVIVPQVVSNRARKRPMAWLRVDSVRRHRLWRGKCVSRNLAGY
jgi:hypothetical protein